MTQDFWIATSPKGQPRPKFARIGNYVQTYDPKQSKDYKSDMKWQLIEQHPLRLDGPVSLSIDFLMPRPKSHYGKKGLKDSAPYYHTSKPDLDNCIKAVKDCAKGILWGDDSQVCVLLATKKYADIPGISIWLKDASTGLISKSKLP